MTTAVAREARGVPGTDWSGLLIDGSTRQVEDARALWPSRIEMVQKFLTLDNLDFIRQKFPKVGVPSIDMDGNDYWFRKALIDIAPDVIAVEYNSSMGFEPITVPYDPVLDRRQKHPRAWYHGASLTALTKLCEQHGYGLAAGSDGSSNAVFTRSGKLRPEDVWSRTRFGSDFRASPMNASGTRSSTCRL